MSFAIVEFIKEQSVELVHLTWIKKSESTTQCFWPKLNARQKAKKGEIPDPKTWDTFEIRIFSTTDDFEIALKRVARAELTSNVESDDEVPDVRLRKKVCRYSPPVDRYKHIEANKEKNLSTSSNISSNKDQQSKSSESALHNINAKLNMLLELQTNLTNIVKQSIPKNDDGKVLEFDMLERPLESILELKDLDNKLHDKELCKSLVKYLTNIGGTSVGDNVRRMMKAVGSYGLWSQYSYKGRKGKEAFCGTVMCKVILKSALRSNKDLKASAVEVEIKEFLKHAPYKPGGINYKNRQADMNISSSSSSGTPTVLLFSSDEENDV